MTEYDLTRETYDSIARKYAEAHNTTSFWEKAYKLMKTLVPKGSTILDVGCGAGRDTKYFLNNGYNVIGIDFSDGMTGEARERVPEGDFQKMDMRELEFRAEYFDAL